MTPSTAEVLAVVQARGGSKSIPRKNVRPLAGHPLVAYSIAAALAARRVTRVIVSTDDPEIADISREYGAEVPFLRPPELARDETPDLPLFQHALSWLRDRERYEPAIVVQLRPTSPLRPADLIDRAVAALEERPAADCVRSVTAPNQNPFKMWTRTGDGLLAPLLSGEASHEPYNMPRQSLPEVLWQTGHVDAIRRENIVHGGSLTGRHVAPLLVERRYAVDIDTEADWSYAEWLLGSGRLPCIMPSSERGRTGGTRQWPARVSLLVLDFDGVLTDDRVWISEDGRESVACSRSDGFGVEAIRGHAIDVVVLSRETNRVVSERCRKLGIRCHQAVLDKESALRALVAERETSLDDVIYVGNDTSDLGCLTAAGYGVAVADAHPDVLATADLVLTRPGGDGAVRELCDLILQRAGGQETAS